MWARRESGDGLQAWGKVDKGLQSCRGNRIKKHLPEKDHGSECPPISDPHLKEVSSEPSAGHLSRAPGAPGAALRATALKLDLGRPKKKS